MDVYTDLQIDHQIPKSTRLFSTILLWQAFWSDCCNIVVKLEKEERATTVLLLSVAVFSRKCCCGQRSGVICKIIVKLEKQESTTAVQ